METLLQAVQRHTESHGNAEGVATTAIPGLTTVRATMPSELLHAIPRPLLCLVLQGSKHVAIGQHGTLYQAGDTLLVTADIPTVSQVTRASLAAPYLALVLELDAALVAELVDQGATAGGASTDADVADAALRMMRLLDRPAAVPVLHAQLVRELHYWLLCGAMARQSAHWAWRPAAPTRSDAPSPWSARNLRARCLSMNWRRWRR